MVRDVPPANGSVFTEPCVEEIRRAIAQYGLGFVIEQIRLCAPPHGRGRMVSGLDDDRIEAMARHLAEDQDLPAGKKGALSELARRVIRDFSRPSDLDEDGSPASHAIKRLIKKFDFFCFDLEGRGWDGPKSNWKEAMKLEIEREVDGRFIAEVPELPGVLVYGASETEARNKAVVLALRVIADRLEAGEPVPFDHDAFFAAAE
jgi:predicted RNase H-like HicB family nuclease